MAQVSLSEEFKAQVRAELEKQADASSRVLSTEGRGGGGSGAYNELASLIGSLNVDITSASPAKGGSVMISLF